MSAFWGVGLQDKDLGFFFPVLRRMQVKVSAPRQEEKKPQRAKACNVSDTHLKLLVSSMFSSSIS